MCRRGLGAKVIHRAGELVGAAKVIHRLAGVVRPAKVIHRLCGCRAGAKVIHRLARCWRARKLSTSGRQKLCTGEQAARWAGYAGERAGAGRLGGCG